MYIALSMTTLQVIAKHRSMPCCLALADLKYPWTPTRVFRMDSYHVLSKLTEYELRIMYSNLCGQHITKWNPSQLLTVVADLLYRLPETDAIEHEVLTQLQYARGKPHAYNYVKGSSVPTLREGGIEQLTVGKSDNEDVIANTPFSKLPTPKPAQVLAPAHAISHSAPAGTQPAWLATHFARKNL